MKEITITKREEGQRFDKFLIKYLPGASSGFLHKMLRKKNIKLNGKKAEGREKLTAGDLIQIFFSDETLEKFQNPQSGRDDSYEADSSMGNHKSDRGFGQSGRNRQPDREQAKVYTKDRAGNGGQERKLTKEERELRKQVRVLYSSEDILVFHKPAGMLSQRAKASDDSLNDYLIDYCIQTGIISKEELAGFRPSIANRLDRNTSGIVLAGISIKGLQRLASMLRERTLGKYYLCLVEGKVKEDARIAGYLTKEEKNNKVSLHKEKAEGASYIETEYKILKIKWKDGVNYQLLHSYELVVPEGTGELSGLHIIDPVPEVFHKVQTRWGLEVPELSYENEAKNRETDNKRAGNTRTGRTTNKKTENARTEKIRKSRRK